MKKILSLILMTVVILSCVGCNSKGKEPDVATMIKTMRSEIDLPDMSDIPKDRIGGYYSDLNADDIVDMAYIIAGSGATADEIFIAKMSSAQKATELKTMMEARKTQQADLFVTYNPDENSKIDTCVIETKGEYALFAICNDNSKAKKIFTDSF